MHGTTEAWLHELVISALGACKVVSFKIADISSDHLNRELSQSRYLWTRERNTLLAAWIIPSNLQPVVWFITPDVNIVIKVNCTLVQALGLCTGRTAHRGSRVIALPFMTMALEGGEGSASRPGRSLPPGKTRYSLYSTLDGPQGRSGEVWKISPPPGLDSRTVQPVASRYTDWATRPTIT